MFSVTDLSFSVAGRQCRQFWTGSGSSAGEEGVVSRYLVSRSGFASCSGSIRAVWMILVIEGTVGFADGLHGDACVEFVSSTGAAVPMA